ncbi:hypothetical protein Lfu02_45240 [Longispora fulva]|uniref:Uncharacterized protein n=1 Tax=Longispora fulva TaxID=619741 RepID=A0A8J7KKC1_9ACTN|nr:hypothetical protein [Longispora fulva]MBG6137899.1 hypothetical protein [Longispora fulva]GIG60152.1 hypothetical protein Lfu02_45240 [Longispora fulva]
MSTTHAATGQAVPRPRAGDHVTPLAEIPVALRGTPGHTHSGTRRTAHAASPLAGRRVRADGVRRGPSGDPE